MRRVVSPEGDGWEIDVEWTGRALPGLRLGRARNYVAKRKARRAARREERAAEPADASRRRSTWGDWFADISFEFVDDLEILAVVAVVVALLVALFLFGPIVGLVALDALELLVFPLIALVIVIARVARHRPFTITARRGGRVEAGWQLVGVRTARRTERAIADAIVAGGDPTTLFAELAIDVNDLSSGNR